jgi:hypothetical protein
MTFNIGKQEAGTINNVAGNQSISGGQIGVLSNADALAILRELRAELDASEVSAPASEAGAVELDAAERELTKEAPRPHVIAEHLERFTKIATAAGAAVSAGTKLGKSLAALARWLGPAGAALAAMLL